jgi:hypothetical protein
LDISTGKGWGRIGFKRLIKKSSRIGNFIIKEEVLADGSVHPITKKDKNYGVEDKNI